jgi:hypothetical protein
LKRTWRNWENKNIMLSASCQNRTGDLPLTRRTLCQLSQESAMICDAQTLMKPRIYFEYTELHYFTVNSVLAQRKRAGLITLRSHDRNMETLFFFLILCFIYKNYIVSQSDIVYSQCPTIRHLSIVQLSWASAKALMHC